MSATDPIDGAMRLLIAAYDLVPSDLAASDPRAAAVRHACRMALDATIAPPLPTPALASFGPPDARPQRWMLHFQDAEVGAIVYDGALHGNEQAELLARAQYESSSVTWNCTLFRIAALDPADEQRQRVRAERLDTAMRTVADHLAKAGRDDAAVLEALNAARAALHETDRNEGVRA